MKKFFHTVTGRMTMIVCIVLLPAVFFTMMVTGFMADSLREQVMSANENEMALFCSQVDRNLEDIETDLNSIVASQWDAMYHARRSGDYSIAQYQCWKMLGDMRVSRKHVKYAYILSRPADGEDANVSITYQQHDRSYLDSRDVNDFLKGTDLSEYENRKYTWVEIGGENYLLYNINMERVSLGAFLDVEEMLGILQSARESDEIIDGFVDSSYQWLGGGSVAGGDKAAGTENLGAEKLNAEEQAEEKTEQEKPGTEETAAKNPEAGKSKEEALEIENLEIEKLLTAGDGWSRYFAICLPFQNMDYRICRIISGRTVNASMPLLQRCLQVISFLIILVIPLLWLLMRRNVLAPLERLNQAMMQIEENNLDYRLTDSGQTLEFQHMQSVFNHMAEQIQHLKIEAYEKDIEKLQIEATNLRLQVSPHMLTNSLNMIYNLALSKNFTLIQEFSLCLSSYFRYSLHRFEGVVSLKEEMKFVDSYIGIQKIRFPEAFVYVYDIEEELFEEKVPPLLIQNFVENSIKYALKLGSEIEILVVVKKIEDKLTISVVDTGCGMDQAVLEKLKEGDVFEDSKGKHIGIWNCRRRLKMYYGEAAVLNISSSPGEGTQVWIEIPVEVQDESVDCG